MSGDDLVWRSRNGDPCSKVRWAMRGRAMTSHYPGNWKNNNPPTSQTYQPTPPVGFVVLCPIGNGLYQPDIQKKRCQVYHAICPLLLVSKFYTRSGRDAVRLKISSGEIRSHSSIIAEWRSGTVSGQGLWFIIQRLRRRQIPSIGERAGEEGGQGNI